MPGIVGLITPRPRKEAETELRVMMDTLCHEEFYAIGTWCEESLGVYVGWATQKNSFSDGMPLRNESGDAVLIFSGEEFPEPGIKGELKQRGHQLDATGPSYLIHRFEEEEDFPARLNGRFHGLLADLKRRTAVLFNDRYGLKRLFYHQSTESFYFAAETKSILAVRPELRSIDPQGLGEFISCGAVLENRTLFPRISLLPPASSWGFESGRIQHKCSYFQPKDWEAFEPLDADSFSKELAAVFSRNLPRYFDSHQRIAMSLTGGLDTRMIMAWQKAQPGSLPCYTFGSMMRENYDVRVAHQIANACQQPFQVLEAGEEFLSKFAYYAERTIYLSDGWADLSRSPDVYLNEKARKIAPVRMTGNYGGEILRQVITFKTSAPLPGLFDSALRASFQQAEETYSAVKLGNPVSFAAFKQTPWNHYGILALEESQLSLRTPFLDNDLVRIAIRAPLSSLSSNFPSRHVISEGNRELLRFPTDRGVVLDDGGMFASARRAFLEFQFKAEYAYDMGMPQSVARIDHALSGLHLERLFLGRHKVFHFRVWYRDSLARYVREMLLDSRSLSRAYVNKDRIKQIIQGHLKGNQNYTNEIHKLLTLELVHRLFVDQSPQKSCKKGTSVTPVVTLGVH